jgi:two-component system sensor histidine kinase UhpB
VREEIAAANRVAVQLLSQLAGSYAREGGTVQVRVFLEELGRVRANDIILRSANGEELYHSPPSVWKAGRQAPDWFVRLLAPPSASHVFALPDGAQMVVQAVSSRAILDAWDDLVRLLLLAAVMLVVANALAFWLVGRALAPFPIIVDGLERMERGDLTVRLPALPGVEAGVLGAAFNRMAQAVEGKVQAERKARDAETRLEERREMARLVEQRIEEERRLIAHELHDEFGQSVTAIRSLALAIATQAGPGNSATSDTARLISDEAARLYDSMHSLIPRLSPLSLDTLGLAETLENLARDWERRYPSIALALRYDLPPELGTSAALAIYRVVQEGLINAVRHAQASRVQIELRCDDGRLTASVIDDGVGLQQEWSKPGHFGLRGLAERVENLGGKLSVTDREPHGVCLMAEIPLS